MSNEANRIYLSSDVNTAKSFSFGPLSFVKTIVDNKMGRRKIIGIHLDLYILEIGASILFPVRSSKNDCLP